jgi:predicted acyl esterase
MQSSSTHDHDRSRHAIIAATLSRADSAAVTPGELMHVELSLLPVAARVRRGHHLRLSLAGADQGTFPMLTAVPATWSVAYGGRNGSTLRVPLKRWSHDADASR